MTAYIISRVSIQDHAQMQAYMTAAPETVAAFGGEYLVRTSQIEAIEGEVDFDRVVVLKFPTKQAARAWYDSPQYEELKKQRWASALSKIILCEGAN